MIRLTSKDHFLITGSTGFVGAAITRALVERGENVTALMRDKKKSWRIKDIMGKIRVFEIDLLDPAVFRVIAKISPTVIIHCAAYGTRPDQTNFETMIDTNIRGTYHLLEALRNHKIRVFIHTGSSSEYGIKDNPMSESDILEPTDNYGVTKAAATLVCQKFFKRLSMPIVVLRLFSPYGYYEDPERLIPYVITHALLDKKLTLSHPRYVRDFVFLEDVVDAYMRVIDNPSVALEEIINIGSGRQYALKDVVEIIMHLTKSSSQVFWNTQKERPLIKEPTRWQANIGKARKLLNWEPQYDLKAGLAKSVAWFQKNYRYYAS